MNQQLLAVLDGSDAVVARFEYAGGRMPVAMVQGEDVYYLAYDQVGSLRAVYTAAGAVVRTVEYDAWGVILDEDIAPGYEGLKVPFGFASGLHDRDTDLVLFGLRTYDPETGRWTSRDPIGLAGGDTDLYAYCGNDPVNAVDPSGLSRNGLPVSQYGPYGSWMPNAPDLSGVNAFFGQIGQAVSSIPTPSQVVDLIWTGSLNPTDAEWFAAYGEGLASSNIQFNVRASLGYLTVARSWNPITDETGLDVALQLIPSAEPSVSVGISGLSYIGGAPTAHTYTAGAPLGPTGVSASFNPGSGRVGLNVMLLGKKSATITPNVRCTIPLTAIQF